MKKKKRLEIEKLEAEIRTIKRSNNWFHKNSPSVLNLLQLLAILGSALYYFNSNYYIREIERNKEINVDLSTKNEGIKDENERLEIEKGNLEKNVDSLNSILKISADSVNTLATLTSVLRNEKKILIADRQGLEIANFLLEEDNFYLAGANENFKKLLKNINEKFYNRIITEFLDGSYDYDTASINYVRRNFINDNKIINNVAQYFFTNTRNKYESDKAHMRLTALNYYLDPDSVTRTAFRQSLTKFVEFYSDSAFLSDNNALNQANNWNIWTSRQINNNLNIVLTSSTDSSYFMSDAVHRASYFLYQINYSDSGDYLWLPQINQWLNTRLLFLANEKQTGYYREQLKEETIIINLASLFQICPPCYFALHSEVMSDNYNAYLAAYKLRKFETTFTIYVDSLPPAIIDDKVMMGVYKLSLLWQTDLGLANSGMSSFYFEWIKKLHYPNSIDGRYDQKDMTLFLEDIRNYVKGNPNIKNWRNFQYKADNQKKYLDKIRADIFNW